MKITLKDYSLVKDKDFEIKIIPSFCVEEKSKNSQESSHKKNVLDTHHWPLSYKGLLKKVRYFHQFKGEKNESMLFNLENGQGLYAIGLGKKEDVSLETVRSAIATIIKKDLVAHSESIGIEIDHFLCDHLDFSACLYTIIETIFLSLYSFTDFSSSASQNKPLLKNIYILTKNKKFSGLDEIITKAEKVSSSVNFVRDLVNNPPNVLHSEHFAERIKIDAKKLPSTKIKILEKKAIEKEKMNLLLGVNAGSFHEPRVVHLEYTPKKKSKNMKHIALVGKGLTFDTGGYSLKPADGMIDMKYDMGGAATVYGAFRSAALLDCPHRLTCILGITDNRISDKAITPDTIIKSRAGKTVEIANTDAEGRLVLADMLDYAGDGKPDIIIDAATLTGACLVAVGAEVCAIMGNHQELIDTIIKSSREVHERVWQLPLFEEYKKDLKSPVADLRNVGKTRFAGSSKAGMFLQQFIPKNTHWAHLDIAGIVAGQSHLPYCPSYGASGLIVRTLVHFLQNE